MLTAASLEIIILARLAQCNGHRKPYPGGWRVERPAQTVLSIQRELLVLYLRAARRKTYALDTDTRARNRDRSINSF